MPRRHYGPRKLLESAERRVELLTEQLGASESLVHQLSEETEKLRSENKELGKLKSELALLKAAQHRVDSGASGSHEVQGEHSTVPQIGPRGSGGVRDSTRISWMGLDALPRMATGHEGLPAVCPRGGCEAGGVLTPSVVTTVAASGWAEATGRSVPGGRPTVWRPIECRTST